MSKPKRKRPTPQSRPTLGQQDGPNPAKVILAVVLLTVAVVIAYWGVWDNDFINFDDTEYITRNPMVQQGLTAESIQWAFTTGHAANWHPLTWLSHMLDCQLFGLKPAGHHTVNLLLHIANTLLLLWALKLMTGRWWPSVFIAALFALHPLHVESVAWASERKDTLSTLFWMLTMIGYARYTQTSRLGWYFVALLALALGLMAKPMLVTLPFVLLLLDYWPLERFAKISLRKLIIEKLPFIAIVTASCIVTYLVQQNSDAVKGLYMLPLKYRIGNTFIAYVAYITKTLLPINLAVFYPHLGDGLAWPKAIFSVVILIAISGIIFWLHKKHRYLATGWLFYLGTLVPVIGLVQVGSQTYADRYTYIPILGLFILVTFGVLELAEKYKWPPAALKIVSAGILLLLTTITCQQVQRWRNSFTLFSHAAAVVKDNYRAYYNIGLFLSEKQNPVEAAKNFAAAIKIKPQWPEVHYNLGIELFRQQKLAEAIAEYNTAIELGFTNPFLYNSLGVALEIQGKLEEAAEQYRKAIALKPDYINARFGLAMMLERQNRKDEAIKEYEYILTLNPQHTQTKQELNRLTQAH